MKGRKVEGKATAKDDDVVFFSTYVGIETFTYLKRKLE